jgi:hypothetical protein
MPHQKKAISARTQLAVLSKFLKSHRLGGLLYHCQLANHPPRGRRPDKSRERSGPRDYRERRGEKALAEAQRIQVRVFHHETQPHRLARQPAHITIAFPFHHPFDLVTDLFHRVS